MSFAEIRKARHYTQKRLAESIGVRQSTVAMWETKRSYPCMKHLLALSDLLEVSLDTLYRSLRETIESA